MIICVYLVKIKVITQNNMYFSFNFPFFWICAPKNRPSVPENRHQTATFAIYDPIELFFCFSDKKTTPPAKYASAQEV